MRFFSVLLALTLGSSSVVGQIKTPEAPAQRQCAAHEKHVQMMGLDGVYAKRQADLERHTAQFVQSREEARANGAQMQPIESKTCLPAETLPNHEIFLCTPCLNPGQLVCRGSN